MQRRSFIRNTTMCAVAISASGFIYFDGKKYVSTCETTTDILGPFYRPGSPLRNNLVIKGEVGILTELSGVVRHSDCKAPYKNARIELWHCDGSGAYDNTTDMYRYRGTSFSDDQGHYSFNTILPVPYAQDKGLMRPAHFHLMVSAEGYMPLITQLYFSGDPYLAKDIYSSSPDAKQRILEVQTLPGGTKKVYFDISMSEKLKVEPATLSKLTGVYVNESDTDRQTELFIYNGALWKKNNIFGNELEYLSDNTFKAAGTPAAVTHTLFFELGTDGSVKLTEKYLGYPTFPDETLVSKKGK